MSDIQRIFRRSEKHLIPRRNCPDCGHPVRATWREHEGMSAPTDPEGDVTWHCFGNDCLTGRDGF